MSRQQKLQSGLTVNEVIDRLGITRWDAILIGDGSGTTADNPCAWFAFLFEKQKPKPMRFFGGFSHGTNNAAEMMAYIEPLLWYSNRTDIRNSTRERVVHVVTDSQYVANGFKDARNGKKNEELWQLFAAFPRKGILLEFHWLERETAKHNQKSDERAGLLRGRLVEFRENLP